MRSGAGASRRQRDGNHFAADIGLDRDRRRARSVRSGIGAPDQSPRPRRAGVTGASLGVYAKIGQSADYRDAAAETVARLVPDLLPIRGERFDDRFTPSCGTCWDGAGLLLVSKNP